MRGVFIGLLLTLTLVGAGGWSAGAQITIDGNVADIRANTSAVVQPDIYPITQPEVGNPVTMAPPNNNPVLGASGFDIREFLLLADVSNDRLYWAITTFGVPGDGDGDGNPNSNLGNLLNNNGFLIVDVPLVGVSDYFQLDIDFDPETVPSTYDLRIQVNSGAINFIDLSTDLPVGTPQTTFALGNGTGDDGCEVLVSQFSAIVALINPAWVGDYTWRVRFFSDTETDDAQEDDHTGTVDVPPEVCCQSLTATPSTTTAGATIEQCVNVINNGPGSASFDVTVPRPTGIDSFTLKPGSPANCSVLPTGQIKCTNVTLAASAVFTVCWYTVIGANPPNTINVCGQVTAIAPATLCLNGPSCCAQITLIPPPGVPTLTEWAAILLSLTLMGLLVVYNRRQGFSATRS
jgi:hypothetical protein